MAAYSVHRSDHHINIHLRCMFCCEYITDRLLGLTRCVFQTISTAEPNGPIPGSAHSPRAAAAHEAASGSHVHRLHTSTGQHAAGPDAAQSTSRELGPLQAAVGSAAEQTGAVAAAFAPVGDDATAVSAAEAAGESAVQADTASFAVAACSPAIEGSSQAQAWAEQPACSTAGSLEDSAFAGHDLSVSEAVVHQTAVQAAAEQQRNRFRRPWLMARSGSKASKVGLPSQGSDPDATLHVLLF